MYNYILGIDFGHGETAAAICAIEWDKSARELVAPHAVDIRHGVKVLPSVISYTETQQISIGKEAIFENYENTEVEICWKRRPSLMNEKERAATVDFMREVYNEIINHNSKLKPDNHCVCIGYPPGWDWYPNERTEYLKIAKSAGLPEVFATQESRAAFIYARSNPTSGVTQEDLDSGLLVVDFGSSTSDFTYCLGLNRPKSTGVDLGASLIDKIIFNHALFDMPSATHNDVVKHFEQFPSSKTKCLWIAREAKEEFFRDGEKYPKSKREKLRRKPKLFFDIDFDPEDMARFLNEESVVLELENGKVLDDSWRNNLKVVLEQYIKNILFSSNNETPSAVLLTGGASRMRFIQDVLKEVYGKGHGNFKIYQ